MTSEGLGEMFEGDSADTCAGKFPLTLMGAERRVSRAQTRERGPHRREWKFWSYCYSCKPIFVWYAMIFYRLFGAALWRYVCGVPLWAWLHIQKCANILLQTLVFPHLSVHVSFIVKISVQVGNLAKLSKPIHSTISNNSFLFLHLHIWWIWRRKL